MICEIPAKTFLVGEYAALYSAPALILTTTPCFKVTLLKEPKLLGIHPEAPAAKLWKGKTQALGLHFEDPYQGLGGLGASSAQFLGAYQILAQLGLCQPDGTALLDAYHEVAYTGEGLKPSAYDLIAQSMRGLIFIHKKKQQSRSYSWPFTQYAFLLVHTGHKLATHDHLKKLGVMEAQTQKLAQIAAASSLAIEEKNAASLIEGINAYHQALLDLNLVAEQSKKQIQALKMRPEILAIKGCGALGADVLLIITHSEQVENLAADLKQEGRLILATNKELSNG